VQRLKKVCWSSTCGWLSSTRDDQPHVWGFSCTGYNLQFVHFSYFQHNRGTSIYYMSWLDLGLDFSVDMAKDLNYDDFLLSATAAGDLLQQLFSSEEDASPLPLPQPQSLLGVRTTRPPSAEDDEMESPSVVKKAKKKNSREGDDDSGRPRRTRVACLHCRRAKVKCDNGRPCSRCAIKGKASECTNGGVLDNKDETSNSSTLKTKENIESGFESYLDELLNAVDSDALRDLIFDKPLK
jgi:hypothetical protein